MARKLSCFCLMPHGASTWEASTETKRVAYPQAQTLVVLHDWETVRRDRNYTIAAVRPRAHCIHGD